MIHSGIIGIINLKVIYHGYHGYHGGSGPIRISVYPQMDNPRTPSRIRIAIHENSDKSG